jgi:hypothetical protein
MKIMNVTVLRTTGDEEAHQLPRGSIGALQKLIACEICDVVNLRDGRVMLVDDDGLGKGLPRNEKATALYHSVTCPGDHFIVGDVVIAKDEDFS